MMTRAQAESLAAFITRMRPDWDHPGIIAAISKAHTQATPLQVARALVNLAENRELRTPALLPEKGQHWRDGNDSTGPNLSNDIHCPEHPEHVHPCHGCRSLKGPPSDDALAELKRIAREARSPQATPLDKRHKPTPAEELARARAKADKEQR